MSLRIQSELFFSDSFTPEDEGIKMLRNGGELKPKLYGISSEKICVFEQQISAVSLLCDQR